MMRSSAGRLGLTALTTALLLTGALAQAPSEAARVGPTALDPGVREALAASSTGEVYVLVLLEDVASRPREELAKRQAEVAARQEQLLSELEPGDLRVAYRFENVAGLSGFASEAGLERLAANPLVRGVGLDLPCHGSSSQSVGYIHAYDVQALGFTGEGITVAVIDSGIDTDHPDLMDDLQPGAWHFMDQGLTVGAGAEDDQGHGTHIAGTITSAGLVAPLGVAPDAGILPVKTLDSNNKGWTVDAIAAVDYIVSLAASDPKIRVINISIGSSFKTSACPGDIASSTASLYGTALDTAKAAGITTFASSGNEGLCGSLPLPAALQSSIAVASVYEGDIGGWNWSACTDSTTSSDQIVCSSNLSPCTYVAAPGVHILSDAIGGGTTVKSGTSMASPHCAGVAALLLESSPYLQFDAIRSVLESTGKPTTSVCSSSPTPPRVDALAALLSLAASQDCNGNGVPDGQDISSGTSSDCNANGVPDSCDLAASPYADIDGDGQLDTCSPPALMADTYELSVSAGGPQHLTLHSPHPLSYYLLLGSASGTSPGSPISGLVVPLNIDNYLLHTLTMSNQPPLTGSFGLLAPSGVDAFASATFTLPPAFDPSLVGGTLNHAFVVLDLFTTNVLDVSNAAPVHLLP